MQKNIGKETEMRARLTKTQMQMLLDGKPLRNGKIRFFLPEGKSDAREILEALVANPDLRAKYSVYININESRMEIEEAKRG